MLQKVVRSLDIIGHYLVFLFKAGYRKGHGVHSPYVYDFVRNVIFDKTHYTDFKEFKAIRKNLSNSKRLIVMQDLGASSAGFPKKKRSIGQMIKISSVRERYGRLFYRIAHHYKPNVTIELGTSIGYSTMFFAKGNPGGQVVSLEGNADLCQFAREQFRSMNLTNIKVVEGLFDDNLHKLTETNLAPYLVFIDGNHDYEPTIKYFNHFCEQMEEGIMLFDDIYWSDNMRRAWKEIEQDPRAHVTIDLFFLGIVIRRELVTPGRYRIKY